MKRRAPDVIITGVTVSQCAAKDAAATAHSHPAPCCYQAAGPAQPLVGTAAGPAHKQPAVKEQPLVRGFSPLSEWWSSGGEQGKRQIPAFSPEPRSLFLGLRLAGELGSLGSRLGAVSCRAPEPPRPLTGWAQALRRWWTSPPPPPLGPHDSGHLLGSASVGPGPPLTHSSGSLRAVGLPSDYLSWEGPGDLAWTKGQWRPASSQPGPGPQRVKAVSEGSFPLLSEQRVTFVCWRFTGILLPDHDLKNKALTPEFATTRHAPLSPFLEKGFAESFGGVWGF